VDRNQGTGEAPTSAARERCSRCGGHLRLSLLLNSPKEAEEALRVYRCESCRQFEWTGKSQTA
jgi:uncharacterized protein with PIN domain